MKTGKPTFNCPKPNAGWWTNTNAKSEKEKLEEELLLVKQKEQELLNQALSVIFCLFFGNKFNFGFFQRTGTKATISLK